MGLRVGCTRPFEAYVSSTCDTRHVHKCTRTHARTHAHTHTHAHKLCVKHADHAWAPAIQSLSHFRFMASLAVLSAFACSCSVPLGFLVFAPGPRSPLVEAEGSEEVEEPVAAPALISRTSSLARAPSIARTLTPPPTIDRLASVHGGLPGGSDGGGFARTPSIFVRVPSVVGAGGGGSVTDVMRRGCVWRVSSVSAQCCEFRGHPSRAGSLF